MPELPEVEFAARQLRRWMKGRRIERVEAEPSRVLRGRPPREVDQALRGRRLAQVQRRGKYLLLAFDGGAGALLHLGMTGKLVRRPVGQAEPYSRARFVLDDRRAVHLRDPRKFGRLAAGPLSSLETLRELKGLGPDAHAPPLDAAALAGRLGRTRRPLKVALMDQTVIAGLGNIHAAEALFRARLSPKRRSDRLGAPEVARLAAGIRETIGFALGQMPAGGADIAYVEEPGSANPFLVYGKGGTPCPRCGAKLRSFAQGGRTTYWCAACQK